MKEGTQTVVSGGKEICPRCGWDRYGCTSKTETYNNGELQEKYSMTKKYCSGCAYVEGDSL